jgi:hypothetical protein
MLVQVGGADGTWRTSHRVANLFSFDGSMGWHPRWGYVVTWTEPPGMGFPEPFAGPFVLCGPSLKPFFGSDWKE